MHSLTIFPLFSIKIFGFATHYCPVSPQQKQSFLKIQELEKRVPPLFCAQD